VGAIRVNSPELAWMEGFAGYFARAVGLTPAGGALTGHGILGSDAVSNLESPGTCPSLPPGVPGDAVENFVAGSLFDLADRPGDLNNGFSSLTETGDTLSRMDTQAFQVFDHELDTGTAPTIRALRPAWAALGLAAP